MSTSWLIDRGLVLDPASGTEATLNIRITSGNIQAMGSNLQPAADEQVFDASGCWIAPGFIDLHTHLRDFGHSDREDIESGTLAAARGGYTTVVAMANTDPPVDNTAALSRFLSKIEAKAHIEVIPVACVTKGMAGVELTNMVELAQMGSCAFSDDGAPMSNLAILRRALEYVKLSDKVIISHAEDKDLAGNGAIHEGIISTTLGLPGLPACAETASVAREIEVVRECGGRLHFAHVSCADSVELIRSAQRAGLAVTAEVTPHHIALTVDDIKDYNTNYKMNPPLRTKADQGALIAGLKDGTLSAIATDHAPHTALDKSRTFDESPFGVIGLETALSVTLETLVLSGEMSKLAFIALLTTKPASILGLPQPSIQLGAPANLIVINPHHRWLYEANKGYSKSHNSPFNGRLLTGKNLVTIYNGKAVYKDDELIKPRLKTVNI